MGFTKLDLVVIREVENNGRFIWDHCPTLFLDVKNRKASFFEQLARLIIQELQIPMTGTLLLFTQMKWKEIKIIFLRLDINVNAQMQFQTLQ